MLQAAMAELVANDPKTYKAAMKLLDAQALKEARKAEVDSLIENKVYTIVVRPTHKQPVTSKWVFKKKRGISGEVEKYKARLVARGFTQEEGVDYTETFSPIIRFESIRLMLAQAAAGDVHTARMDVTTSFLYAALEE